MKRRLVLPAAALALAVSCAACASSREPEFPPGKSHVTLAPGVTVAHSVMEATKTTKIEDLGYREISEAEFLYLRYVRTGTSTPPSPSDASYVYREYAFVGEIGGGLRVKAGIIARVVPLQMGHHTVYVFDEVYEDMAELSSVPEGAFAVRRNYVKAFVENHNTLQVAVGGYAELTAEDGIVRERRHFSALHQWRA
ncbi:MAG: hypothetical protein BAA01_14530 [Bacillus thermozeamaize]|uniref:Lipoprotein n=1 Tax=Bacillus thermozeamaize TaxID=230954 RepID=A0A1Y3PNT3_9BACI|nr:MAG: hypothetical protein BAA01_14530 [Bacillus thermozeamaize]